jgi:dTDP-4-dehydrorhamnose reductase
MIGILGASGLIGFNLYNYLIHKGIQTLGTYCSTKKQGLVRFDLLKDDFSLFDKCSHAVIAAGITNIDDCFRHKEEAYKCNVEKTIEFIAYLKEKRIRTIFLSSDQVFDGQRGGYVETDQPNPVNHYGRFKLQVEEFIKNNLNNGLVLRLSKIYTTNLSDGGIFAEIFQKLKSGKKVLAAYNQIYNPTHVGTVCQGIIHSINSALEGLYHLADKTIMSRYEFAQGIARDHGFDQNLIEAIDFNTLLLLEKRALNSSLNVEMFNKTLGLAC